MRQAIILAGGAGTRLRERLGDLPKPMIPIGGKPLLEHQVELCRRYGFTELLFFTHHRADLVEAHFGNGSQWGVQIRHLVEREPLGTAGAVLAGLEHLAERFVVLYGDTMVNVDLNRLWNAHQNAHTAATLLLHPNDHPLDSDLVEIDAASRITAFHNRPHPAGRYFQNLVNAGLYVIEKSALAAFSSRVASPSPLGRERAGVRAVGTAAAIAHETPVAFTPHPQSLSPQRGEGSSAARPSDITGPSPLPPPSPLGGERGLLDFGKDLFPALLRAGDGLLGYNSPEYIKDIGTPARYDRVDAEFANGTIARSSLQSPQRAVFLDRDGTLIIDQDCLRSADGLVMLPGVPEAIRELNHHGWRAVVVTNQPVIAKGWATAADLQVIHNKLETLLGLEHAFLDRIYYCPHHPDAGFAGEVTALKIRCNCRKPATGMIEQATAALNIDLAQSWLVGDTTTDLQTARNAGLRSILVRTGSAGKDGRHDAQPDAVADSLREAVRIILSRDAVATQEKCK